MVVPSLVSGGFLIAGNVISHEANPGKYPHITGLCDRVDALVVPIGKGLFACRKL
jgi:hypothetical protein